MEAYQILHDIIIFPTSLCRVLPFLLYPPPPPSSPSSSLTLTPLTYTHQTHHAHTPTSVPSGAGSACSSRAEGVHSGRLGSRACCYWDLHSGRGVRARRGWRCPCGLRSRCGARARSGFRCHCDSQATCGLCAGWKCAAVVICSQDVVPCHVGRVGSCPVMSCHVMSRRVTPGHVLSCRILSCHVASSRRAATTQ